MTLFDLLIVATILGFAYWGWLVGLETASVAALELLACLVAAVMLHEAVAGWLQVASTMVLGDWASQAWSILLAFAGLAWGSFATLRLTVHGQSPAEDSDEDETALDPLTDRLAGAVAGGLGGAVFAGGVLVTLSMVPFLAGLKPSGDRLLLDVGKTVLRAGGQFATERHDGRCLPLWGEPPSRMAVMSAGLTSEPWFDADEDGKFGEADRFRDVDGNGTFTKDLYFTDVDGDGLRRVGLIDKYVVGRWDGGLASEDRPRPDLKKPAPPTPTAAKPPVTEPSAPTKPNAEGSKQTEPAKPNQPSTSRPEPAVTSPEQKPAEEKPGAEKAPVEPPKPAQPRQPEQKPVPEKPAETDDAAPPPTGKLPSDDF